jgi:outer membrane lipoprotein-sorting protein
MMKQVSILLLVLALGCTEKQVYESSASEATTTDVSAKPTEAPAVSYDKYIGVYKMQGASFDEVAITQEGGKLFAQATGERKVEIYPEKENTFNVPAFNAKITFNEPSGDAFSGISVWLDGAELKGIKK